MGKLDINRKVATVNNVRKVHTISKTINNIPRDKLLGYFFVK